MLAVHGCDLQLGWLGQHGQTINLSSLSNRSLSSFRAQLRITDMSWHPDTCLPQKTTAADIFPLALWFRAVWSTGEDAEVVVYNERTVFGVVPAEICN